MSHHAGENMHSSCSIGDRDRQRRKKSLWHFREKQERCTHRPDMLTRFWGAGDSLRCFLGSFCPEKNIAFSWSVFFSCLQSTYVRGCGVYCFIMYHKIRNEKFIFLFIFSVLSITGTLL